MRRLAEVALQSLKQRCRVHARGQGEVLPADLPEPGGIPEILALTDDGSRNLHLDIHVFLGNAHDRISL